MIQFQVPGLPQGKGRARFGAGRAYTPAKTVAYEGLIGFYAGKAMAGRELLAGPISLRITASFPIPPSWSKKRKAEARYHIAKPDGDNILKAVGDGCNTIVWHDDSHIAVAKLTKVYGETAGLDVIAEVLA